MLDVGAVGSCSASVGGESSALVAGKTSPPACRLARSSTSGSVKQRWPELRTELKKARSCSSVATKTCDTHVHLKKNHARVFFSLKTKTHPGHERSRPCAAPSRAHRGSHRPIIKKLALSPTRDHSILELRDFSQAGALFKRGSGLDRASLGAARARVDGFPVVLELVPARVQRGVGPVRSVAPQPPHDSRRRAAAKARSFFLSRVFFFLFSECVTCFLLECQLKARRWRVTSSECRTVSRTRPDPDTTVRWESAAVLTFAFARRSRDEHDRSSSKRVAAARGLSLSEHSLHRDQIIRETVGETPWILAFFQNKTQRVSRRTPRQTLVKVFGRGLRVAHERVERIQHPA